MPLPEGSWLQHSPRNGEESLNLFVLRALCKIHLFFSTVHKREVTHIASFHYAGFFIRMTLAHFVERNDFSA